ncbi:MAG: polysaccharide deacetylase family protein [bacterium]|nr:polysaccharide deacetylase family protein [bacterium]
MLKVTTSWDDGDILDKHLSDLLLRYGLKGTFYISKNYRAQRISDQNIKNISKYHEIGAHTITHPDLRACSSEQKRSEIKGSKQWLEELLGSEVKMFCYPKGFYNNSVVECVKEADFVGARTTELGALTNSNPFLIPTTIQVYPFPFRRYLGKFLQPYKQRAPALKALGVPILSMYSWLNMSKTVFDIALERGEVFHLWGHSWEIEKYGMWNELEKFLQYIESRKNCVYLTNSELLK